MAFQVKGTKLEEFFSILREYVERNLRQPAPNVQCKLCQKQFVTSSPSIMINYVHEHNEAECELLCNHCSLLITRKETAIQHLGHAQTWETSLLRPRFACVLMSVSLEPKAVFASQDLSVVNFYFSDSGDIARHGLLRLAYPQITAYAPNIDHALLGRELGIKKCRHTAGDTYTPDEAKAFGLNFGISDLVEVLLSLSSRVRNGAMSFYIVCGSCGKSYPRTGAIVYNHCVVNHLESAKGFSLGEHHVYECVVHEQFFRTRPEFNDHMKEHWISCEGALDII